MSDSQEETLQEQVGTIATEEDEVKDQFEAAVEADEEGEAKKEDAETGDEAAPEGESKPEGESAEGGEEEGGDGEEDELRGGGHGGGCDRG